MLHKSVLDGATLELLENYCQLQFLKNFSLAGGTALALRLGHRLSFDLDMFTTQKFNISELDSELQSFYGMEYSKRGQLSNALFSTVKNIKSDFVYDYGKTIHPNETIDTIRIYPIEENIAMKLSAITGRGRKRDFFDLYFILQQYSFHEIIKFFSEKFGEERLIMLFKSLTYFEDAEADNDPILIKKKILWADVKKDILNRSKEIKF